MANDSPSPESPERSLIGKTIRIRGELDGNEDLTFLGRLEGQLNLNGFHLTVGEGATVNADVRARMVSIDGSVTGNIQPSEVLTIHSKGVASGTVVAPRLITEDGCRLSGEFVVGLSHEGASASIPDFDGVRRMLEAELAGLAEAHLDFSAESPVWARWSIRRQVSHMANSVIMWLVGRWEKVLWAGLSPDPELVKISQADHGHDRMLDPEKYRDIQTIMKMIQRAYDLIREVASRENAQSIKEKKLVLNLGPNAKLGTSNESAQDLWIRFRTVHENGIVRDNRNPNTWTLTLEAMFRHLHFEHLAHIRTIQRLKELQGLKAQVTLDRVGYLTFNDYWGQ